MLLATASASNATNTLPPLDLSWAITATIAVVAFLSPIVVAIINNHHSRIMRQMDIAHQETIKKMESDTALIEKQFSIYYADKKAAFSDFLQASGQFSLTMQSTTAYEALHSSADKALLFCNGYNQELIIRFLERVDEEFFGKQTSREQRKAYTFCITYIASSLNTELLNTKPPIE